MTITQIEKRIIGKMSAIKRGEITPKESNLHILFNVLKEKDEVAYGRMIQKYKKILQEKN